MNIKRIIVKAYSCVSNNPIKRQIEKIKAKDIMARLDPGFFLPQHSKELTVTDSDSSCKDETYKVGILYCEETCFNVVSSVYYAFCSDSRFDTEIILQGKPWGNSYHEMAIQLSKKSIKYRYDFDCKNDRYEVVIANHDELPPTSDVQRIINNAKFVFSPSSGVITYEKNGIPRAFIDNYNISAFFLEKSLYNSNSNKGIDCYITGSPKMDYVYNVCEDENYRLPPKFEQLKNNGKIDRIVLWTTDHVGGFRLTSPEVSFDLYAKCIFRYFDSHNNMGLVFRPFKSYIDENIRKGLWSREQLQEFRHYCDSSPNIIWDDEPECGPAFRVADAILTDVGCGFICEALPTGKPIGIPLRWDCNCDDIIALNYGIISNHYSIKSEEEMIEWLNMIERGEDYNYERRKAMIPQYVTYFDGKNAERMKKIILEQYLKID